MIKVSFQRWSKILDIYGGQQGKMEKIKFKKKFRLANIIEASGLCPENAPENTASPKAEYDTPWKRILDLYFEDFIALCWPEKHAEIDWEKGYKSLDKELSKLSRNAPITNRIVDKLLEVCLKNGEEVYILFHLEVQGDKVLDFEERMFVYRCRLRDSHNKPIVSLGVLIDRDKSWRPGTFKEEFWGCSVEMKFPIIKLIDFKDRIAELKASNNRFAAVILAQLAAIEKNSLNDKLTNKINLIKGLYRRGWEKEDIQSLLIFIDWVLALPEEFDIKCKEEIHIFEEGNKVEYVTSFERLARKEGIQQGESALLLNLLEYKFKEIPDTYRQKIADASAETLLVWGRRVLDSNELSEIFEA